MDKEKLKKLVKTWDEEAKNYTVYKGFQVDYLANYEHLERCLGKLQGKKILEVGSGTGQTSAYLASKGAQIHLLDISKKSLDFSKKYFDSMKLRVKLYHQNAFNMEFSSESFDYVWNGGVIEHFNDNEKILLIKKMWKLVKPGGKLLITVPNSHDIPFMIAKKVLQLRNKWSFGFEDNMSFNKLTYLAKKADIPKVKIYAYNPLVGFWFFPFGREITDILNLNTLHNHKKKTPFGHVLIMYSKK